MAEPNTQSPPLPIDIGEEPNWYWKAFDEGLIEGLYAFGHAFPFLMVSLLCWFATIMIIPIAIRKARRLGKDAIEAGRDLMKPNTNTEEG